MVSSNCIQSIIHYSQSVDCSFCVHVLFSGPDVHHRVIAVQPWDVFSIVNTSCKVKTHHLINNNKDIVLQQEFSSLILGFRGLFFVFVVVLGWFSCHVAGIIQDTGLKYISCHCERLLHGLPRAVARKTHNATRLSPGCSTQRWTSSQFRFFPRWRTSSCQGGRRRNWLSWRTGQDRTKQANNKPIRHVKRFFPLSSWLPELRELLLQMLHQREASWSFTCLQLS